MTRYARHWSIALAVLLIASFLFAFPTSYLQAASKVKMAGADALTVEDLEAAYAEAGAGGEKVRILVMPGHEPTYGGAQYDGYYERELVVMLSEKIATELRTNSNFEVIVARDQSGWNADLSKYFKRNMKTIKKFVDTHKKEFKKLLRKGKVDQNEDQAGHNAAPGDVAYRLYGITKWSNENDIDLMIHVHLNDAGDRSASGPGAYTGLSIYVPYKELGNAEASKEIANEVFDRLTDVAAKSTLETESQGVVEDQELIALGANNTSAVPSILVEYGYIYEPKFTDQNIRDIVFSDYARQTARGVGDFFGASVSGSAHDTRVLPYTWTTDVTATSTMSVGSSIAVYALQHALKEEGFYPPRASSLVNCPIDGRMSSCVIEAITAFQNARGITPTGTLNAATRNALNAKFAASYVPEPVTVTPPPVTTPPIAVTPPVAIVADGVCTAFTSSLTLDATDAKTKGEVTRLQKILAQDKTIYPEGKVTGYFGPVTEKAVKAFQVKNGITKPGNAGYGLVGPATSKALLAVCK